MSVGENNKKFRQTITIFSITEKKILAYRYFFSMSDEESHSESEFYYPEGKNRPKTSKITRPKLPLTETKISVAVKRNYKSLFKNRKVETL